MDESQELVEQLRREKKSLEGSWAQTMSYRWFVICDREW